MARIGDKDQEQIAKVAATMQHDVVVDLFTQRQSPLIVPGVVPCETCTVTEEVLADLTSIVPRLKVRTHDAVGESDLAKVLGVDRVPTLAFDDATAGRITFVGAPLGYEFSSFFSAVLEAGGATTVASAEALAKLAGLQKPIELKVFVTPT